MREGSLTTMVVVALAAALLFVAPSWVSDLGPIPDAIEYAVTAQRLAHLESFRLLMLGQELPSRYQQRQTVDIALARNALVYTDAYSLAVVRYNPGYDAERRALEAYELAPVPGSVRSGRVLLFRLLTSPTGDSPIEGGRVKAP